VVLHDGARHREGVNQRTPRSQADDRLRLTRLRISIWIARYAGRFPGSLIGTRSSMIKPFFDRGRRAARAAQSGTWRLAKVPDAGLSIHNERSPAPAKIRNCLIWTPLFLAVKSPPKWFREFIGVTLDPESSGPSIPGAGRHQSRRSVLVLFLSLLALRLLFFFGREKTLSGQQP
jgi:hypothetical protein